MQIKMSTELGYFNTLAEYCPSRIGAKIINLEYPRK